MGALFGANPALSRCVVSWYEGGGCIAMGGGNSKDETLRLSATDNMPAQDDPEAGRVTTPKSPNVLKRISSSASNTGTSIKRSVSESGLAAVESRLFKAASNAFSGDTNAQLRCCATLMPPLHSDHHCCCCFHCILMLSLL